MAAELSASNGGSFYSPKMYQSIPRGLNGVDNFGIVQTHVFALDLINNAKLVVLPFVCKRC